MLVTELTEYFNQPGIAIFKAMSDTLSSAAVNVPLLSWYPEFNLAFLRVQLTMFRNGHQYTAADYLQSLAQEVHHLFSQVEALIRLMLVMPATSCECERSFSTLRRLKTWLRSTMGQERLNSTAIFHVHQDILDSLNLTEVCSNFIQASFNRMDTFGRFWLQLSQTTTLIFFAQTELGIGPISFVLYCNRKNAP